MWAPTLTTAHKPVLTGFRLLAECGTAADAGSPGEIWNHTSYRWLCCIMLWMWLNPKRCCCFRHQFRQEEVKRGQKRMRERGGKAAKKQKHLTNGDDWSPTIHRRRSTNVIQVVFASTKSLDFRLLWSTVNTVCNCTAFLTLRNRSELLCEPHCCRNPITAYINALVLRLL